MNSSTSDCSRPMLAGRAASLLPCAKSGAAELAQVSPGGATTSPPSLQGNKVLHCCQLFDTGKESTALLPSLSTGKQHKMLQPVCFGACGP